MGTAPLSPDIRPSPIAGLWYEGNPKRLAKQIDDFIDHAGDVQVPGEVAALISPHAGYRYSGRTAGYAYRAVKGMARDLVVILSPLHAYHPSPLLTTAHQAYGTPLGEVYVDQAVMDKLDEYLMQQCRLRLERVVHDGEHSLEIEVPFLQRALAGDFRLLPIMIRDQDPHLLQSLGKGIAQVVRSRSCLLVASTDLSHFYPEPIANTFDAEMLRQIEAFSPEGVLHAELKGTGFACGAGAVAAALWTARELGADKVQILHHSTSADETGDRTSVVGYGAAAVYRSS